MKKIMSRRPGEQLTKILKIHATWLAANGYKLQASSCKKEASSYKQRALNLKGGWARRSSSTT
jgi:hypothetical protein